MMMLCGMGCTVESRTPGPQHPAPVLPPPAAAPSAAAPDASRLSGNVDVRPFTAHEAFAHRRPDGAIDIKAFDRPVGRAIGCMTGEGGLVDTQRTVWIQMTWPAPVSSVWTSSVPTSNPNTAGVFFMVRRGLGGSGQRASGNVRVEQSSASGGVLFVDAATANKVGGVHGSVRGMLPFTMCN
jgi:hypothetical protein